MIDGQIIKALGRAVGCVRMVHSPDIIRFRLLQLALGAATSSTSSLRPSSCFLSIKLAGVDPQTIKAMAGKKCLAGHGFLSLQARLQING